MPSVTDLRLSIQQREKILYAGSGNLDAIVPYLPTGRFSITFEPENRMGTADMFLLLSKCRDVFQIEFEDDCKLVDWEAAWFAPGSGVPIRCTLSFVHPLTAFGVVYVLNIARVVSCRHPKHLDLARGKTSALCFARHVMPSGIRMFLTTGKFCGGRLFPLDDPDCSESVCQTTDACHEHLLALANAYPG